MKWWIPPAMALCTLAGCAKAPELMPLEPGTSWSYSVRTLLLTQVTTLRVARTQAGQAVLESEMGRSVLRWKDRTLVAHELVGTRFDPPLPLVRDGEPKWSAVWTGRTQGPFPYTRAEAKISQEPATLDLPARKLETIKSVVELKGGGSTIRLETWFAKGIGIVRQEQLVDGAFTVAIQRLKGPS